jgi:hypothetical protein
MFSKHYLLAGAIVLSCTACSQTPPANKSDDKKTAQLEAKRQFLEQGSIFFDNDKLKEAVKKYQLSDREVMEYCRKNEDAGLRAKFIGAIFSEKEYNDKPAKSEFWAAYRFNLSKFTETVTVVREEQKTFMDIGSGNGEKLYGALCMGFDKAYGLEYSEQSYKTSLKHLENFKAETEVTLGDALAIEGSFFKKADFLYMYSPIKDNNMMATLFQRAMENMNEGAILLEVRCVYGKELSAKTGYNFPTMYSWLAVKKKDGKYFYKNVIDSAFSYDKADHREWQELKKK